jgi:hypothetical protein
VDVKKTKRKQKKSKKKKKQKKYEKCMFVFISGIFYNETAKE